MTRLSLGVLTLEGTIGTEGCESRVQFPFSAVYGCAVPARQCQFRGITTRLSHTSHIGPVSSGKISSISPIGNFLKALSTAPFLEEVIEPGIDTLTVLRRIECRCGSLAGKAATPGCVHGFSHVGELTPISGGFSATSAATQTQLIRTCRDLTTQRPLL